MHLITKLEAAKRQLNAAIRLLFSAGDAIAVHSLAVSAASLFSDLADHEPDVTSWREMMREDHGMTPAQIKSVINRSWNFFKHADRDPQGTLEFDAKESEYIIFFATLECGELSETSTEMQVFQLWFLATGRTKLDDENEIQRCAETLFPGLHQFPRETQLSVGAQVLGRQLAAESAKT
ncbi:hypothetical protein D9M68_455130 [compost metagenome]